MGYSCSVGGTLWRFDDLRTLLAKATPLRSGDVLAGLAAQSELERVAARICLADISLRDFLAAELIPEVDDEISAPIAQQHDAQAFAPVSSLTVDEFREYLLGAEGEAIARLARGPDAGNGRRSEQTHAQHRLDRGVAQNSRDHKISNHIGSGGPVDGAKPAQPPN